MKMVSMGLYLPLLLLTVAVANLESFVPVGSSNFFDTQGKIGKTQQRRDFMNRDTMHQMPFGASKDIGTPEKIGKIHQKRGSINRNPMPSLPFGASKDIETPEKIGKIHQKRGFINHNPMQSLPFGASKDIETHDQIGETYEKRGFMNRYTMETLFYRCDKGYLFKVIYSTYQYSSGDRIWEAYCNIDVTRSSLTGYHWAGYQNELYQDFQFKCSNNGVLAGIVGSYSNGDRKYDFLCAYFPNKKPTNCESSDYTVVGISWTQVTPKNKYLTGIDSIYDHNTK